MHFCSDVNNCLSFLHPTRFHFQKCIFKMHKTPNFPYQGYCLCGGMQAPLRCCEIPFLEKIEPWGRHSQFKQGLKGVNTKLSPTRTLWVSTLYNFIAKLKPIIFSFEIFFLFLLQSLRSGNIMLSRKFLLGDFLLFFWEESWNDVFCQNLKT